MKISPNHLQVSPIQVDSTHRFGYDEPIQPIFEINVGDISVSEFLNFYYKTGTMLVPARIAFPIDQRVFTGEDI